MLRVSLTKSEMLQLSVVIAVALIFAYLLQASSSPGQDVSNNSLVRSVLEDRSSPSQGSQQADLTLVVFTDYQCAACRAAYPAMKRAVASDGKVRIVYKDWPIFGAASKRAAEVALASRYQNLYPDVHDRLMTGAVNSNDALRAAVEQSGGNWRNLQHNLAGNRSEISSQLERNARQAFQIGLPGTPGYLIGPTLVRGALTEREFTNVFRVARDSSSERYGPK